MGSGKGQAKRVKTTAIAVKDKQVLDLIKNHSFEPSYKSAHKILSKPEIIKMITSLMGEAEGRGVNLILNTNSYSQTNSFGSTLSYADGHTSFYEKSTRFNRFYCDCGYNNDEKICLHRLTHATYQFILELESFEKEMPLIKSIHDLQLTTSLEQSKEVTDEVAKKLEDYIRDNPRSLDKYLGNIYSNNSDGSSKTPLSVINLEYVGEPKNYNYEEFVRGIKEDNKGGSLQEELKPIDRQNTAKVSMFVRDDNKSKKYLGFNEVVSGNLARYHNDHTLISYQEKENGEAFLMIKNKDSILAKYNNADETLEIIANTADPKNQEKAQKFAAMMFPLFARVNNETRENGRYKPYTDELREALGKYNAEDNTKNGTAKEKMRGVGEITGLAQRAAEYAPIKKLVINGSSTIIRDWLSTSYEHIDTNPKPKENKQQLHF